MKVALSTSVIAASLSPDAALARWRALAADDIAALTLDERWTAAHQDELLRLAQRGRVGCIELAHPAHSAPHRPAASPVSADRAERRAAAEQLEATVLRAAHHDVLRVLVRPWRLPLTPAIARLRWLFALDHALPQAELEAQRSALAAAALDGLRSALDRAVEAAARRGVEVVLAGPTPWPHYIPRGDEVRLLLDELAGAPLSSMWCTDWACVAVAMGHADDFPRGGRALRVADACGLSTRLPLGSGALVAADVAEDLRQAALCVLTLGPDADAAEVRRSVVWLAAAARVAQPAPAG